MNITDVTDILLAALHVELAEDNPEDTIAHVSKQPGDSIVLDMDADLIVWVRLVSSTPTIGTPGDVTIEHCYWGLAHEIEMGVQRRSPMPDEALGQELILPEAEDISAAADLQYQDLRAMQRALIKARSHFEFLPGTYALVGRLGGFMGGTWSLTVIEEP